MEHSFDVEIAEKYGMAEAILLKNIYFWCKKNESNGKSELNSRYFHEGRWWTYNSASGFLSLFPYLSQAKIYNALNKLKTEGLLLSGNFNITSYDRTQWWAVTDKGTALLEHKNIVKTEYKEDSADKEEAKKEVNLPENFIKSLENIKKVNNPVDNSVLFKNKIEKPYTKGLQNTYKVLKAIHSGMFRKMYILNEKWEEQQLFFGNITDKTWAKIQECKGDWDKTFALFEKACSNFASWFLPTTQPVSKEWLDKVRMLENFMYNAYNKQSYFLCCVNGGAKELDTCAVDSMIESLSDSAKKYGEKLFRDHFDKFDFWTRISGLEHWYDKNAQELIKEEPNARYWLSGGKEGFFKDYYNNIMSFTEGRYSINQIGTKNKTWLSWLDIIEKEFKITI